MMLKQSGFKPRGGSVSTSPTTDDNAASKNSANNNGQPTSPVSQTSPTSAGAKIDRTRRKSSGSFTGLENQKRKSTDLNKPNWTEQTPGSGGILSSMWNKTMKGNS